MSHPIRNQVFISYCHADSAWLQKLQVMLKPPVRNDMLILWDDTMIKPGRPWKLEVEKALASTKVAVLLVSDNFLASEFVAKNELPQLLDAEREGVRILWVCLSDCLFEHTEIGNYQAAHNPEQPLDSLQPNEQKKVLADICRRIIEAARSKTPAELAAEEEEERRARVQAAEVECARLQEEISSATVKENWEAVIKASEALLSINPADNKTREALTYATRQQDLLSVYTKGKRHYEDGDLYMALKELQTLNAKEGNYKDVGGLISHIESRVKEEEMRLKDAARAGEANYEWGKVVKSLEALLKLTPYEENVRLWLTDARQKQVDLDTAYNEGLANLGKDLHVALKHFLQARGIGGNYKDVDTHIASVQLRMQRQEDERRRQEEAAKERAERLLVEGDAARDKKDWLEAIRLYTIILQIDRNNANALEGLKFAKHRHTLRSLYTQGEAKYKEGKLDEALGKFREVQEIQEDYKGISALITKIERKRARRRRTLALRYYVSLIISFIGILVCLTLFIGWALGSTPQPSWRSLFLLIGVTWISLLYFSRQSNSTDTLQSLGCLATLLVLVIPFITILGRVIGPVYGPWLAERYMQNASQLVINNPDQAIDNLTTAININPQDARAYHYRGLAYRTKGDYERAIKDISRAIELDRHQDTFFINRGWIYYLKHDYDKAFADFAEAISLNPGYARHYYLRGIALFDLKAYDRAILDFDRATKAAPDFAEAFDSLGQTYHAKGETALALSSLTKALEVNPSLAIAYVHRGKVHAAENEFDKAIADFNSAMKFPNITAEAYFERAKAYINRNDNPDYNQAIVDLGTAANKAPNNAEILYYLGLAHYRLKEYDQAISRLDQAINLTKDYGYAYDLRGSAYIEVNKYELAINDLSKAIALSSGSRANSYYYRGIAYANSGNTENAITDFQKVLEFKTSDLIPSARQHLRRLAVSK